MHFPQLASVLLFSAASALSQNGYDHTNNPNNADGSHLPPCSQAVVALAAGIHLNIQGQYGEYNATLLVENVETTQAGNTTAFYLAKGQLQANVQAGQNIRLTNQQIAPPGNPAIPGLAKYAAAEETEKGLAAGLVGEYSVDKAAIESLKSDIMSGIQLNENNLKNATSQCDFTLAFPPADEAGS